MQNRACALSLAAAAVALVGCGSSTSPPASKIVNLTATLTPPGEIGANLNGNPSGNGTFTATLDTSTNVFSYNFTFTGLTTNVIAGHIHGPFAVGGGANSAGVILNFATLPGATFTGIGATAGSGSGSVTLNAATAISATVNGDSLRKLLLAGLTYANIHTQSNPGGEIRGQLSIKQP